MVEEEGIMEEEEEEIVVESLTTKETDITNRLTFTHMKE